MLYGSLAEVSFFTIASPRACCCCLQFKSFSWGKRLSVRFGSLVLFFALLLCADWQTSIEISRAERSTTNHVFTGVSGFFCFPVTYKSVSNEGKNAQYKRVTGKPPSTDITLMAFYYELSLVYIHRRWWCPLILWTHRHTACH